MLVLVGALLVKFQIYREKADKYRAILNLVILFLLVLFHTVGLQLSTVLGSGFSLVVVALVLLILMLVMNIIVSVLVVRKARYA
jgi:hypothetical protein